MRQNIFMGGGPFGSTPELGQFRRTGYQLSPYGRQTGYRLQPAASWTRARTTTPAARPAAASKVKCYFCGGLPGMPTYWLSADQAEQWNSARNAQCVEVDATNCREKYGQSRAQQMVRRTGFSIPVTQAATTQYASPYGGSMMTGIRVQNPELIG